jgi:tRNA pseudouridine55 synthase
VEGIIVVNKPDGITSHDVVARIRRKLKFRKVGHAGTLDPLATGVLVILLGKATKLFDKFVAFDKAYRATMILGKKTDSADIQGKVLSQKPYEHITESDIKEAFKKFEGEIDQVPPMVSAVKKQGKKLYELARVGIVVERQPRRVIVKLLRVETINFPEIKFFLECSKGTYVRQLAEDIGELLGCGACITQIQRTRVGKFTIDQAVTIEDLNESHIQQWSA